jgi:hypothetical protein
MIRHSFGMDWWKLKKDFLLMERVRFPLLSLVEW